MLEKWTFNKLLFSRLTDVLDISITEMAKRCNIRQQVLSRYVRLENELPVKVLIKMCNALRMPCYYFVSENKKYEIPNRETATVAADQWHPVGWDSQAVERTFGSDGGRIFWKDVAAYMDLSPSKPHERFLLRTRFPVEEFLDVCNHFNLSPFDFLVDDNRPGDKRKARRDTERSTPSPALLADIAAMRQQMASLTAKYDDMLEKYASLLESHKALLQRFDEHISSTYIGMAADD